MADPSLRVLVVDDSPDAADALVRWARRRGHRASAAHTAPVALVAALGLRPDVVLVDIGLPGMDGCALARRLRADPALAAVALVAVTGYTCEGHRRRAEAAGFDCYLVKPVDPVHLEGLLLALARRV
jgi:CheY-like chemotaxis protein